MIQTRFVQWSLLLFSTLVFMTSGFPNTFTSAVFGQERDALHQPSASLVVTSRDEQAAKRLYNRVMQEFHKKDYEAALAGFRFFLELYGNSGFAASAQYWVGESEYRMGRYKNAIESFSLVLKVSQQRSKLAGATLKMALAYEKLGQTEASRILFERLLGEFSGTPESEIARKHLNHSISPPLHVETGSTRGPTITDDQDISATGP